MIKKFYSTATPLVFEKDYHSPSGFFNFIRDQMRDRANYTNDLQGRIKILQEMLFALAEDRDRALTSASYPFSRNSNTSSEVKNDRTN